MSSSVGGGFAEMNEREETSEGNTFGSEGGDFPGGMPGRGAQRSQVDTESLYQALGLEKSCSQEDVKKAYRRMAIKHHPDKGGDEATFKEITKAYDILSDEKKRQLYDQGGEEAVESGGGMGDAHDIFSAFFGGGKPSGPRKGEDLVHPIATTLEHLYNGKLMKLALKRNVICDSCNGSGSKNPNAKTTCESCDGLGIKLLTRQIAPGMIQQMKVRCPQCEGTGTAIKNKDRCSQCEGKKVVEEKKMLEVQIEKGMQDRQKIVFKGEADQSPGTVPGDVIFVLQCKQHATFLRKGDDLLMEHKVKLVEALCGAEFVVRHLDDRALVVRTTPGSLLRPGDVKAVDDEGMPMHRNPFVKGKLYIRFDVEFPADGAVTLEMRTLISQIIEIDSIITTKLVTSLLAENFTNRYLYVGCAHALPAPPVLAEHGDAEEVAMRDADLAHMGRGRAGAAHDDDDDDEEEGGRGPGVQCAQQ